MESVLLLGRAEIEVLTDDSPKRNGRFALSRTWLRSMPQFQQQQDAWEAELQLWDPATGYSIRLADLRDALGSTLVDDSDDDSEDPPLTARLMWRRGERTPTRSARTTPRQAAPADLRCRRRHCPCRTRTSALDHGHERRDAAAGRRLLALIDAEESGCATYRRPTLAKSSSSNADDRYLRAYALWRRAAGTLRRRRDAGHALREAYRVAEPVGCWP